MYWPSEYKKKVRLFNNNKKKSISHFSFIIIQRLPNKAANIPNRYGLPPPASNAAHPTIAPAIVPIIRQKLASNVPPLIKFKTVIT
jgi:hypothetical protein